MGTSSGGLIPMSSAFWSFPRATRLSGFGYHKCGFLHLGKMPLFVGSWSGSILPCGVVRTDG